MVNPIETIIALAKKGDKRVLLVGAGVVGGGIGLVEFLKHRSQAAGVANNDQSALAAGVDTSGGGGGGGGGLAGSLDPGAALAGDPSAGSTGFSLPGLPSLTPLPDNSGLGGGLASSNPYSGGLMQGGGVSDSGGLGGSLPSLTALPTYNPPPLPSFNMPSLPDLGGANYGNTGSQFPTLPTLSNAYSDLAGGGANRLPSQYANQPAYNPPAAALPVVQQAQPAYMASDFYQPQPAAQQKAFASIYALEARPSQNQLAVLSGIDRFNAQMKAQADSQQSQYDQMKQNQYIADQAASQRAAQASYDQQVLQQSQRLQQHQAQQATLNAQAAGVASLQQFMNAQAAAQQRGQQAQLQYSGYQPWAQQPVQQPISQVIYQQPPIQYAGNQPWAQQPVVQQTQPTIQYAGNQPWAQQPKPAVQQIVAAPNKRPNYSGPQ